MILRNISLKKYNTFGLDYKARNLISVKSEKEAISVLEKRESLEGPLLVMGGGSNLLFINDYKGTIILPEMDEIEVVEQKKDHVVVSSGAGANWDGLVEWTVSKGYGGLENLSFIPGKVGAAPVQNIGAYGSEVKNTIERVRAISIEDCSIREFGKEECMFGYRDSIFKRELKRKYIITKVSFRLSARPVPITDYGSLKEEAEKLGPLSVRTIRKAVINIRRSKLPDPEITGNAGSFFKNPVVETSVAESIRMKYHDTPVYDDIPGYVKIGAGWLIDKCGWKGKRFGDAGVHDRQALVIVNHGNATGKEILDLSEAIKKSVIDKFGIELQREVEVIGSI